MTRNRTLSALCTFAFLILPNCDAVDTGDSESAVVGGQRERGYAPAGYLRPKYDDDPICGVVLIRPDVALTAAHCVVDRDEKLAVGFGKVGSGPRYRVRYVVTHPKYNSALGMHDIAVLILRDSVHTQALARIATPHSGEIARYIGYGRTTDGDYELTTGYTGQRRSAGQRITSADDLWLHTQGVDGGLCRGDSGGPLMREAGLEVYGVLAHFDSNSGEAYCQSGNRMVFTSVASHQGFIDTAIRCPSMDPSCLCETSCADRSVSPGECNSGWECVNSCAEYTGCETTCDFYCEDLGLAPGECDRGFECVGECLENTGCESPPPDTTCEFACDEYDFVEGECWQGWQCTDGCVTSTDCEADEVVCEHLCDDYNYDAGDCQDGWLCESDCLTYVGTCE